MRNYNKIFFTLTFCASYLFSFAQEDLDDEVKKKDENVVFIEILDENPKNVNALTLQIPIWHLAGSKINTSLLDLKGEIAYTGKGMLNGGVNYKYGLGDKIAPETIEGDYPGQDLVMSIYEPGHAQDFNIFGSYFFNEKIKDVEETIKLKTVGKVSTVTNVKTQALIRTGLTLGYSQGFTWYNFNNVDLTVKPKIDQSQERIVNYNSMSSVQTYKFLKIGINKTKMVNLKLNAEGYGKRESRYMSVHSFNMILALQNKFDDVYVGFYDTKSNVEVLMGYTMDDSNKKLPIGFEYLFKRIDKKSFVSYEAGVKYLPGLMKNINLMVNFGISINIDFLMKR